MVASRKRLLRAPARGPELRLLEHPRAPSPSLDSVVRVHATSNLPDYEQPWQTLGVTQQTGSGVIVRCPRGLRILTNAHVVEGHVFVEVRRYGHAGKAVAQVEAIGHHCDLALLRVDDAAFMQDASPLEIGDLPELGERVSALGYPLGGERLSITQGVVSRVEMSSYAHSDRRLLTVQIDAAINSGNSGGPVVHEDKLVGIAFQALEDAESIGYLIAAPVVTHFLSDVERGDPDGFPDLGADIQRLENKSHRRSLGIPRTLRGGVLVSSVHYQGSAQDALMPSDVLLELDGQAVASDGTVEFRHGERIDMSWVLARHHVGESISAKVWRAGKLLRVHLKLAPPAALVVEERAERRPRYRLYGGLLFVPLTVNYLATWGADWQTSAPAPLIAEYEQGRRSKRRLERVVLQKVLPDAVNGGYHDVENTLVERVDGKLIKDFAALCRHLDRSKGEFLTVELSSGRVLVLDNALVRKHQSAILAKYDVPRDRTVDEDTRAQLSMGF